MVIRKALSPGFYVIRWNTGHTPSYAAVGVLHDGTNWFACVEQRDNSSGSIGCDDWTNVESVLRIVVEV